MPRAKKWVAGRGNLEIETKRKHLDGLKATYVIWSPYDDHIAYLSFQPVFLYSGFIRHDKFIHPHLPYRVVRQLSGIQREPSLPPTMKPTREAVDQMFAQFQNHTIRVTQFEFSAQTYDDYML